MSIICQHVHRLELCNSFIYWLLWQYNKCTEKLFYRFLLYFLFWTCMSEIKSHRYFSFNLLIGNPKFKNVRIDSL